MPRTGLLAVFLVPAGLCALWTVVAGKDLNWDLLNYHYYVPYEFLTGRLEKDFFAASAQSYLNPVGYVPFYLMVSSGWHSVVVSITLAVAHALCLALLYLIAWQLFASRPPRERVLASCLATGTAAATAVFWPTIGTSFLDPLLVVPMLAGLLALVIENPSSATRRAAAAGLLFGAAAGLKYSNGIFALAAFPLVLTATGASRLRACAAYVLGGVVAVGALAGPWMALMYRELGNPVFPFMNGWFRSPYAPPVSTLAERFAPDGVLAAAAFPFRMALPERLYAEILAPDLRFAALAVAALALPVMGRGRLTATDWRVFSFFAVSFVLWLASSGNGRYGLIVLLLAGLCLARLAERLLPLHVACGAIVVLLVAQAAACALVSPARWFAADRWSRHWLLYAVPERALHEPALYVTVEALPMASIAPFMHADSSFINVRGQHSLVPGWRPVEALFARHRGHVRALGRSLRLGKDGKPRDDVVRAYDNTLVRFGYRVDPGECFAIPWRRDDADWLSRAANWLAGEPSALPAAVISMASCALRPAQRDPRDIEKELRISALFDRIEKACPRLFRGQTAPTDPLGAEWARYYPGLEARLETHQDRAVLNRYLALTYFDLGPLSDWERGSPSPPAACR